MLIIYILTKPAPVHWPGEGKKGFTESPDLIKIRVIRVIRDCFYLPGKGGKPAQYSSSELPQISCKPSRLGRIGIIVLVGRNASDQYTKNALPSMYSRGTVPIL